MSQSATMPPRDSDGGGPEQGGGGEGGTLSPWGRNRYHLECSNFILMHKKVTKMEVSKICSLNSCMENKVKDRSIKLKEYKSQN